ncbi:ISL3 family transposase [Planctomicrobium sp. SH661]|uniref:ISL3 family transposase n=1 Tax=Planctomicrobium sp. SH661 TaxID=3448124 RepID=UPI003F5BACCB
MSSCLLYHALGVRGYRYLSTRFEQGEMIVSIELPREKLRCPACGHGRVHVIERFPRMWRTVSIGLRPVFIEMDVPKVQCQRCSLRRRVEVTFAQVKRRHTRSFQRYVMELLTFMTPQDVGRHLGISWDLANDIQKQRLRKHFSKPRLKHLKRIAIDEIHVGKKHRFITLVLDLESGAVVFVGKGKGADALKPFWKRLTSSRAQVQAVATDMSPAYISAVLENLPDASLVFDRFHIMKLLNEKLTQLRRELFHEAEGPLGRQVLKGTRWLLLKNPESLDHSKGEHLRLKEALQLNQPLAIAYYLKDELRMFWEQETWGDAMEFLEDWCRRAQTSGIRILQQFARTLQGHRSGLLAWYHHPISTGPLEGVNNKIKLLQRRAYGYRNLELFQLRILSLHTTRFEIVG